MVYPHEVVRVLDDDLGDRGPDSHPGPRSPSQFQSSTSHSAQPPSQDKVKEERTMCDALSPLEEGAGYKSTKYKINHMSEVHF